MSASRPRLLADIGGTNARFALQEAGCEAHDVHVLQGAEHANLADAARAYLQRVAPALPPLQAAFDIACPVLGDQVTMTNHHWSFSIEALRVELGLERLVVVNDFAAVARSIPALAEDDRVCLGGGVGVEGAPIGVLGPGTGLGVSSLIPSPSGWIVVSGEGGHVTMPAADDRESAVLAVLRRNLGHISAERVISGMGLVNLHAALCELNGQPTPELAPADITDKAQPGGCAICAEAVRMFCAMLGSIAGNLALTLGARGGIYIAGGIVPKLGSLFDTALFRSRFEDKGRFAAYLAPIPTYLIRHANPAFLGLAEFLG